MPQKFKVSVCMITYGHEKYIREAIEGVLMQECNFEVELILANDCSPDLTDEIIQDIIQNHPRGSWIKYFKHEKNLGMMPNFIFALEQCCGTYVAMCEGDDYWISVDKLQKQVEILEENNKIGLVYTNVKYFFQSKGQFLDILPRFVENRSEVIPVMLKSKFVEFASTLFRKSILDQVMKILKPELEGKIVGDTRVILETVNISKLYYLNEVTTVYRIVDGSASHPLSIEKYIFASLDSYNCRKEFVLRNDLNKSWLSYSICNTNKGLVNRAFTSVEYKIMYMFIKNLLIVDTFKFCSKKVFFKKMNIKVWVKLMLSLLGIGVLIQKRSYAKANR
jgi:glycosyltransferase involved in cell wall biosynthesis